MVKDDGAPPLNFDTIFAQYVRYVKAVALRLLANEEDADDVSQEVFWACYKHAHKIQNMTHARRWLMQVTVQQSRRLLRKRKLAAALHLAFTSDIDPPMPSASSEEKAAVIYLFSILQRMRVNHRMAWSLRYLEGAELNETSSALGCSPATAKRWIAAAQKQITGGAGD